MCVMLYVCMYVLWMKSMNKHIMCRQLIINIDFGGEKNTHKKQEKKRKKEEKQEKKKKKKEPTKF